MTLKKVFKIRSIVEKQRGFLVSIDGIIGLMQFSHNEWESIGQPRENDYLEIAFKVEDHNV